MTEPTRSECLTRQALNALRQAAEALRRALEQYAAAPKPTTAPKEAAHD
jgi:hypothetical protein